MFSSEQSSSLEETTTSSVSTISSSSRTPSGSSGMTRGIVESIIEPTDLTRGFGTILHDVSPAVNGEDQLRLRPGRKGHRKSRKGCFNCKRARIKCKENRPSCDHCAHRDLRCEWPDLQVSQPMNQPLPVSTVQTPQLPVLCPRTFRSPDQVMPVFTMQDFRLFTHFIRVAYPQHPPRNDSVWTHEIPSLSSDHDFLLYSMLALSASDLASADASTSGALALKETGLHYRVKAITSLNHAISQSQISMEKGNAMLAACFSLLFQSVLLEDGLIEYMTFIRGVLAVSVHMGIQNIRFLFQHMFNQQEVAQESMQDMELIRTDLAGGACRSLEKFADLVVNPKEVEYYGHLLSAARDLFTSSSAAFGHLSKIYGLFAYFMSHAEFATFIDPANEVGKLLMTHFAALQLIMTPITLGEKRDSMEKSSTSPGAGSTRWLSWCNSRVSPHMRWYYEWTIEMERDAEEGNIPMTFSNYNRLTT